MATSLPPVVVEAVAVVEEGAAAAVVVPLARLLNRRGSTVPAKAPRFLAVALDAPAAVVVEAALAPIHSPNSLVALKR